MMNQPTDKPSTSDPLPTDPAAASVPLCVDLDGTLIRSDLLWESLFSMLGDKPERFLQLPGWLLAGKAVLKDKIAGEVEVDAATLPYRASVLAFLRQQKDAGRTLVLATASHEKYADAVATHLGLFDHVIATTATTNCRGEAKVQAIRDRVGDTFDYIGDSDADLPLLEACRQIHLANPSSALRKAAEASGKIGQRFTDAAPATTALADTQAKGNTNADGNTDTDTDADVAADTSARVEATSNEASHGLHPLLKLIRPHQWAKNLLIFVPMLMGHRLDAVTFGWTLLGFAALCAAASSIYIFNDLVDIESDRKHPTKRRRPLATGAVAIPTALKLGVGLLVLGLATAGLTGSLNFFLWVMLYLGLTLAYSFWLKRKMLVDVIVLSGLYTHRVIAGGVLVADVFPSPWLLAFSSFFFVSLAFAKRYTELAAAHGQPANARRGYRPEDLPLIGNVGPTSGYMALLVFALYINDPSARDTLYTRPDVLWLVVPVLMYWITRVWFFAYRGKLDADPIVFAIRDRVSYACIALIAALILLASV